MTSTQTQQPTDLLVIGGGAVGMTLSLAAGKQQAALLAPPLQTGSGRYYALGAKAMRFIQTAAGSTPPQCTAVHRFFLTADGQRYEFPSSQNNPSNLNNPSNSDNPNNPLCTIVSEEALTHFLGECLHRAGIVIHLWSPIQSCNYDNDAININLESASDNAQQLSARMLAVADGAWSATARALNVGASIKPFKQRALTIQLRIPALPQDCAAQWFLPRDILALLPIKKNTFALIWSLPESAAQILEASGAAKIAAAVQQRIGVDVEVDDDNKPRSFPLLSVRRAVPCVRRAAFIGDAAQIIHPLAGQGLNIGLANAELLLDCRRQHPNNITAALSAFSATAVRRTALWDNATRFFNRAGDRLSPLFYFAGTNVHSIDQTFNTTATNPKTCSPRLWLGKKLRRFAGDMDMPL